jgi:hypothetical protein
MRMRRILIFVLLTLAASCVQAQWQIEDSGTTADLRGIDNVGGGVAWASGAHGTVLRTVDNGAHWQTCSVPPGAEALDFRGVQAFDAQTAIVMSSGKGDLSRLYKTADGCRTWKLVFTNPDKDGFWDAYRFDRRRSDGILIGDPVSGHLPIWMIERDDSALQINRFPHTPRTHSGEAEFAASNSALFVDNSFFDFWIATGGKSGARVIKRVNHDFDSFGFNTWPSGSVPIGHRVESSGVFGLSFRPEPKNPNPEKQYLIGIAVGGDYLKPDDSSRTAASTFDGGKTWRAAQTMPNGYRSSVAYDTATKTWITVGANGTDISTDDGRNWRALHPNPALNDPPDADRNWNALSLPFVVGPHGRIGKLNSEALAAAGK